MVAATAMRAKAPNSEAKGAAFFLPLGDLVVDRTIQTRQDKDPEVVASMRASMRERLSRDEHPQETPCWVMKRGKDWVLIAGFTRKELLHELHAQSRTSEVALVRENAWVKSPTIWCLPKENVASTYGAILENFRENIDRQSLSLADQAEALARLAKEDPKRGSAGVADDVRRSKSHVENLIRAVTKTTPEMVGAFRRKAITIKDLIRLAAIEDREDQQKAFDALLNPETASAPPRANGGEKAGSDEGGVAKVDTAKEALKVLTQRLATAKQVLGRHVKGNAVTSYARGVRDLIDFLETGKNFAFDFLGDSGAERARKGKAKVAPKKPSTRATLARSRKTARRGR